MPTEAVLREAARRIRQMNDHSIMPKAVEMLADGVKEAADG